ncbi:MAG: peptidoglycan-binding protein [Alphaproteobacteria bacterium]
MAPRTWFAMSVLGVASWTLPAEALIVFSPPVPKLEQAQVVPFPGATLARQLHLVAYNRVVAEIQAELNGAGYDAGPSDGLMGNRTRRAIEAYQRQQGLLVTGQPSQGLLDHLRASARSSDDRTSADADRERRQIVRLQRRLERLDYDVEATGELDRVTRSAIRSYQQDHGLLVTGEISDALMEHVRASVRAERGSAARTDGGEVGPNTIRQIQHGLRVRGYTVGNVSGELDIQTGDAIRAYQRDRGDAITGQATEELAAQLSEGVATSVATPENIRKVQQALNRRGYSVGPADGVMGPSTRSAISRYRQENDLPVSSDLSAALLESLGIASSQGAAAAADSGQSVRVVISDDFEDGNYTDNPRWQVVSKEFRVADGALRSSVKIEASQTREEIGRNLLKGVLDEVLGVPSSSGAESAAIVQATTFTDPFEIRLRLRETASGSVRMHLGPFTRGNETKDYRLAYDSSSAQPLLLVADRGRGSRSETLAATSRAPALDDGQWHELVFSRRDDGTMTVSIDGNVVLRAHDTEITGGHDGISFVNAAGDWDIDSVAVTAAKP